MLAPVVTLLMGASWVVISTYNDAGVGDSSVMARLLVSCLVLAALAGCGGGSAAKTGTPPAPTLTDAVASELDRSLHEMVEDSGVPGASAAVVFADGSEWTGNAGDAVLKPRRPMTSRTALPFDSVTKVAVAALTMRLVEQHKLALDDPISKWDPAWRGDPEASIRDLLGHTSGMGDPPEAFWKRALSGKSGVVTPREFVAAAGKPGARTDQAVYSNSGFILLGLILERVTGEPAAVTMRAEVFDHPGGDGLALQPGEHTDAPRAESYWYPHGLGKPVSAGDGSPLLPSRRIATMAWAAGALAGDVPSLARWGQELFDGQILEPGSLKEMAKFHPGAFWDGYGLGLAKTTFDNREMWGHTGDGQGSHTEFWHLLKENMTIAVTWNDAAIDTDGGIFQRVVRAANY
jgi:D-alanyl-D-alanine carboxypeptidase